MNMMRLKKINQVAKEWDWKEPNTCLVFHDWLVDQKEDKWAELLLMVNKFWGWVEGKRQPHSFKNFMEWLEHVTHYGTIPPFNTSESLYRYWTDPKRTSRSRLKGEV